MEEEREKRPVFPLLAPQHGVPLLASAQRLDHRLIERFDEPGKLFLLWSIEPGTKERIRDHLAEP